MHKTVEHDCSVTGRNVTEDGGDSGGRFLVVVTVDLGRCQVERM